MNANNKNSSTKRTETSSSNLFCNSLPPLTPLLYHLLHQLANNSADGINSTCADILYRSTLLSELHYSLNAHSLQMSTILLFLLLSCSCMALPAVCMIRLCSAQSISIINKVSILAGITIIVSLSRCSIVILQMFDNKYVVSIYLYTINIESIILYTIQHKFSCKLQELQRSQP